LPDTDVIGVHSQLILEIGAERGRMRVDLGQIAGDGSTRSFVIRGLDPRIHHLHESRSKKMDCRVISREDALRAFARQ
jgi:hypothetical protein